MSGLPLRAAVIPIRSRAMHSFPAWNVDPSQILTRSELRQVLANLLARAPRLANVHLNLTVVRLACCCGLRASEMSGLRLPDVCVGIPRPNVSVRAECAKHGRPRRVPLWWDDRTLSDLTAWKARRQAHGADRRQAALDRWPWLACGSTIHSTNYTRQQRGGVEFPGPIRR